MELLAKALMTETGFKGFRVFYGGSGLLGLGRIGLRWFGVHVGLRAYAKGFFNTGVKVGCLAALYPGPKKFNLLF